MNYRTVGLSFIGLAILPVSAAAYFVHRDLIAPPPEMTPTGHLYGGATLGDDRLKLLDQLTRDYLATHKDAPAAIRAGTALAPTAFLNHELERRNEKWRVSESHGLVADTYDVS